MKDQSTSDLETPGAMSHSPRTDSVAGEFVTETLLDYDGGRQVTVYVPPNRPEVVVFAGDGQVEPLNRALVEDIRAAGAKAVLAGPEANAAAFRFAAVGHQIRPMLEMLPLQMTSLALAQMAGHEAGKFERIAKVTTAE